MKQTKFFELGDRFRWYQPVDKPHPHKWVYEVLTVRNQYNGYTTNYGGFSRAGYGLLYRSPPIILQNAKPRVK